MELTVCSKVCNQCPFSSKSLRGWLGDVSVEDTLEAQQSEQLFSCHLHRQGDPAVNLNKIMRGVQPICRGYMISAHISCKSFGQNHDTGEALKKLSSEMVITDEEKEVILTRWAFKKHHTI